MPVSVEYQNFASGTYDWKSTDAANAPLQINSKLDTWVSAVNANAVNASKQVTVLRDPLDSTGTRAGWVIRFADGTQPGFIYIFFSYSAVADGNAQGTGLQIANWTDNTTNDGYGGIGAHVFTTSAFRWYLSGQQAEFIISSSSDPGEEFFILAWNQANNSNYRDNFAFFKDQFGNWTVRQDRNSARAGIVQNTEKGLVSFTGTNVSIPISNYLIRPQFISEDSAYTGGQNASKRIVIPAHPKLWMVSSSNFNFGGYYTANSREFLGVAQYDWVVEL